MIIFFLFNSNSRDLVLHTFKDFTSKPFIIPPFIFRYCEKHGITFEDLLVNDSWQLCIPHLPEPIISVPQLYYEGTMTVSYEYPYRTIFSKEWEIILPGLLRRTVNCIS